MPTATPNFKAKADLLYLHMVIEEGAFVERTFFALPWLASARSRDGIHRPTGPHVVLPPR